MKLYHGSNVEVKVPKVINGFRRTDFGAGFYLTTDYEQAKKWAEIITHRRKKGNPIVSVFEIDDMKLNELKKLEFESANEKWLKFVAKNRNLIPYNNEYDIIIGPVADDNTMLVISRYLSKIYNEEETLRRLLPYKLKNQYVFKTKYAISKLKFIEVIK